MTDRDKEHSPATIPQKRKITRRSLLLILLGAVAAFLVWFYKHLTTAESIQAFFGLDDKKRMVIQEELTKLKRDHLSWWVATVCFFTLADWRVQFLVPQRMKYRVINYWSWRIFSRRSIAWEYVNYPKVGDDAICDGLIRPSGQ